MEKTLGRFEMIVNELLKMVQDYAADRELKCRIDCIILMLQDNMEILIDILKVQSIYVN